ncbi:hypothetical protein O181_001074 [Austropuccinia psidii MF-1]|uniref:Uncharacterized protein n=1 Tax=Austropuccinia psidii MF-1 TaxID=1389203 RepID=A0A9Q3B9S2_9BASI|nr:hypothetical protein [Austropuccinia psidii MF-1]
MSASTCAKKAANGDTEPKPLLTDDMYSMLSSLKDEAMSLKSACSSDAAEIQLLHVVLSSPWALLPRHTTSAYDRFMQEPYRTANSFAPLKSNGSNFSEWLTCLNRVLCVALNTEISIENSPSSINNQSPHENRAICHFIDASIPHEFALCIGITPLKSMAKAFFDAIKARFCPGNHFENSGSLVTCLECWSKMDLALPDQTMC